MSDNSENYATQNLLFIQFLFINFLSEKGNSVFDNLSRFIAFTTDV